MRHLTAEWIEIAEDDLSAAQAMIDSGRLLFGLFSCQQALEKMFKALIQEKLESGYPSRTHDLGQLAQEAGLPYLPEEYLMHFATLQPYYISARYPGFRERLRKSTNEEGARALLHKTREVLGWLRSHIK